MGSTSVFIALLWSITLVACSKDHEPKSGEPTIVIPDGKVQVAVYSFPNWGSAISSEWVTLRAAQPQFNSTVILFV